MLSANIKNKGKNITPVQKLFFLGSSLPLSLLWFPFSSQFPQTTHLLLKVFMLISKKEEKTFYINFHHLFHKIPFSFTDYFYFIMFFVSASPSFPQFNSTLPARLSTLKPFKQGKGHDTCLSQWLLMWYTWRKNLDSLTVA